MKEPFPEGWVPTVGEQIAIKSDAGKVWGGWVIAVLGDTVKARVPVFGDAIWWRMIRDVRPAGRPPHKGRYRIHFGSDGLACAAEWVPPMKGSV
jgi:hypothetical protein